jgi:hypothetical protein
VCEPVHRLSGSTWTISNIVAPEAGPGEPSTPSKTASNSPGLLISLGAIPSPISRALFAVHKSRAMTSTARSPDWPVCEPVHRLSGSTWTISNIEFSSTVAKTISSVDREPDLGWEKDLNNFWTLCAMVA